MLNELGLYGLEAEEDALLCGLILRAPILLVGGHGTGKTTLCERLAEALELSFLAYDASKSLFEDVLGFPNPDGLARGEVDYVSTPLSIWGRQCVLIDELSRANPAMQSKWFEVIRSHRIMGAPLPDLQQVLAAMNPPSYAGAFPLDEALAGRFAVVLRLPDAHELSPADRRNVILNPTPTKSSSLLPLLDLARQHLDDLSDDARHRTADYVDGFAETLRAKGHPLDGRRLHSLHRLLCAALALERARGRPGTPDQAKALWLEVARRGLPFLALDVTVAEPVLRVAHEHGHAAALGRPRSVPFSREAPTPALADALLSDDVEAEHHEREAGLTTLIKRCSSGGPEERLEAIQALGRVAQGVCATEGRMDSHDTLRTLRSYRQSVQISSEHEGELMEVLQQLTAHGPRSSGDLWLASCLAVNAHLQDDQLDVDDAAVTAGALLRRGAGSCV